MKYLIMIFLLVTTVYAQKIEPVPFVSASKFSGLWYEIARTYNSYQERCMASSVEYKLVEKYEYEVFNRCFDTVIGGDLIEYSGSAEPSEGTNMSSIDMTYFWIFTKKYHVYYLQEDYSYAVVADEEFEQVWIMSRKPFMPKESLNEIILHLSQAMDTSKFIYTPQDEKGKYR